MTKKNFIATATAATSVALSVFFTGCSEATVSNTTNVNSNQAVVTNTNVSSSPASNLPPINSTSVPAANTNTAMVGNSAGQNANRKPAQAVKEPTPYVGSGGSDLLVFTQARTALSFDRDLQTNVIIDVKEGNVTLTGKAASAELKAKAEQAIKAVSGVKSIKNNITVAN